MGLSHVSVSRSTTLRGRSTSAMYSWLEHSHPSGCGRHCGTSNNGGERVRLVGKVNGWAVGRRNIYHIINIYISYNLVPAEGC
jgi:hypothetical protein